MSKKFFTPVAYLALLCLCIAASCTQKPEVKTPTKEEMVARGKYLAEIGGCHDCHSPKTMTERGPIPDESRLLSGYTAGMPLPEYDPSIVAPGKWILFNSDLTASVGPWGTTFAANLTPDKQTGLGLWTDEIFIKTLRTGKHLGTGRPILPPMPWPSIGQMTDDDLKALFAYLQSVPPVKNAVPAPIPPSPPSQ